jgi:hypothetical protein
MKDFARPRGRLRSLPLPARVVYSVFLLFTLAALAITAWLAEEMVGHDLSRVSAYYAGATPPASSPRLPDRSHAGPVLDLPPDADVPAKTEPMPARKLLEVTHFHLFSMPVYLLILSHLFMLSRSVNATKVLWNVLGTASVAGHILAPWGARAGAASAAFLYGASGAVMTVSFLVMSCIPLWEMWAPGLGQAQDPD